MPTWMIHFSRCSCRSIWRTWSRGRGIASILLTHVLDDAAGRRVEAVLLETGSMSFFAPARALYRKFGFVDRGPFGTYNWDANSVYMELVLTNWTGSGEGGSPG